MAEYSTTYDASVRGKVKVGAIGAWVRHIARDIDEANGCQVQHSNTKIDPARTHMNMTFVNDGNGGWRRPDTTGEIINYANSIIARAQQSRIDRGFTGLRKDAIGIRGLVLQLDPEYVERTSPNWKENGLSEETLATIETMVNWASQEFGHWRLPCFSIQMDEYSVQVQSGMIPIRDDNCLDQKYFFKGPKHFRQQHESLRQYLRQHAGYEARDWVSDRSTEGLDTKGYEKLMDETRQMLAEVEDTRDDLLARTNDLDARESIVTQREAVIEAEEEVIRQCSADVQAQQDDVTKRSLALEAEQREWEERKREEEERIRAVSERAQQDRMAANDLLRSARARATKAALMLDRVEMLYHIMSAQTKSLSDRVLQLKRNFTMGTSGWFESQKISDDLTALRSLIAQEGQDHRDGIAETREAIQNTQARLEAVEPSERQPEAPLPV